MSVIRFLTDLWRATSCVNNSNDKPVVDVARDAQCVEVINQTEF